MGTESTDDRPDGRRPEAEAQQVAAHPVEAQQVAAHPVAPQQLKPLPSGIETLRVEALRTLHDRYAGMLWRYVVSLTHRPADADDVVQETLLRAWRQPALLEEDPEQVHGWLFTVAHNLVVDQARSAYRRHEEPVAEQPESTAEDRIDRLFDALLLRDALASLGADHREVIVRAYYGGCSTPELAAELGIPEGTVKSRLHYGLRALRLAFEERGVIR